MLTIARSRSWRHLRVPIGLANGMVHLLFCSARIDLKHFTFAYIQVRLKCSHNQWLLFDLKKSDIKSIKFWLQKHHLNEQPMYTLIFQTPRKKYGKIQIPIYIFKLYRNVWGDLGIMHGIKVNIFAWCDIFFSCHVNQSIREAIYHSQSV